MDSSRAKLLDQLISGTTVPKNFVHFVSTDGQDANSSQSDDSASWLSSPSPWLHGILQAAETLEATEANEDDAGIETDIDSYTAVHEHELETLKLTDEPKAAVESNYTELSTNTNEHNASNCHAMPQSTKTGEQLLRRRFEILARKSFGFAATAQVNCSNVAGLKGEVLAESKSLESKQPNSSATTTTAITNPIDEEAEVYAALGPDATDSINQDTDDSEGSKADENDTKKPSLYLESEISEPSEKQQVESQEEPQQAGTRSLCSADKPIPILNLPSTFSDGIQFPTPGSTDGYPEHLHQQAHQLRLHQQHPRQTSKTSVVMAWPKKPVVGNSASADISHLALDCRDLASYHDMQSNALLNALCRWCLRRVFRADWNRDCYLCDLPLTHSCLMCFCALHAPPDHETTRSYNAVVCSTMRTACGHVYHRHCWTRWEEELSTCCPKCNAAHIAKNVKETFIIEKRCK